MASGAAVLWGFSILKYGTKRGIAHRRERRKLDEEARDFRNFVEELKRAKDREEFDAYMAKRRSPGNGTANA